MGKRQNASMRRKDQVERDEERERTGEREKETNGRTERLEGKEPEGLRPDKMEAG